MKTISITPLLIKTIVGVLTFQFISLVSADARPNDRHKNKVPSSVVSLDSAAHDLVENYQRGLRSKHAKHQSRSEARFLQAAKNFETNAHNLRSTIESNRGYRRAQNDVTQLRNAYNVLTSAANNVRLNDRARNNYNTVRSLMRDIERNREAIYASADSSRHNHRHDDRNRDSRPRPGVLGRIFGK